MVTAVVAPHATTMTPQANDDEAHLLHEQQQQLDNNKLGGDQDKTHATSCVNLEPISLTSSDHSENVTSTSTSTTSNSSDDRSNCDDDDDDDDDDDQLDDEPADQLVKCSAVHTLERDMPTFDYSHLVVELREQILSYAAENPGTYSPEDLDKCRHDDWYLSRFLLRHQLQLELALEMLKATLRFNNESLANHLRREDFPAEFYQLGGLLPYGQDRKGNRMLWMRVRVHKKTPEIQTVVQAFIYFNIRQLDELARGRGIAIVIDCQGAGLANADMEMLFFLISTLKNYFPKGLSYFLVHEIPWILKPMWHLAKAWVPEEHRQLVKFSDAHTIGEYVDRDNLPAYLGGRGQLGGLEVPENCTTLEQACKLWGIEKAMIRRVLAKFRDNLPAETVERIEKSFDETKLEDEDID